MSDFNDDSDDNHGSDWSGEVDKDSEVNDSVKQRRVNRNRKQLRTIRRGKLKEMKHNKQRQVTRNRKGRSTSFASNYSQNSSEEENYFISKEFQELNRRQRRFTKSHFYSSSSKQNRSKFADSSTNHKEEREREERLQEMDDILEEMKDYIHDYRKKKEFEIEKKFKGETVALSKTYKKYPKPGTNPQVTFKPENFLIKSGFIYKKGLKRRKWYKRFFRLFLNDPHSLYYYPSFKASELDVNLPKNRRKGKKINLLFANIGLIKPKKGMRSSARVSMKRYHRNKNILNDYMLFVQTKTVKKVPLNNVTVRKDPLNNVRKFKEVAVLGRIWYLCCLSEIEVDNWFKTLKYIEEQTQKCIKQHKINIKKGLILKKAYFKQLRIKEVEKLKKSSTNEENEEDIERKGKDDKEEGDLSLEERMKYDRAQLISCYGEGIKLCKAGETVSFIIIDNYKNTPLLSNDDKVSKSKKRSDLLKNKLNINKFSIIIESEDLHYDLTPYYLSSKTKTKTGGGKKLKHKIGDIDDEKIIVNYLLTRRGKYELSILYNNYDIYGSPYIICCQSAPISSTYSYLEGINYALYTQSNERNDNDNEREEVNSCFVRYRNKFEEKVKGEEGEVEVDISSSEDIEIVQKINIDYGIEIKYRVKNLNRRQRQEGEGGESYIRVLMNDNVEKPSFMKEIKNSPLILSLISTNSNTHRIQDTQQQQERVDHEAEQRQTYEEVDRDKYEKYLESTRRRNREEEEEANEFTIQDRQSYSNGQQFGYFSPHVQVQQQSSFFSPSNTHHQQQQQQQQSPLPSLFSPQSHSHIDDNLYSSSTTPRRRVTTTRATTTDTDDNSRLLSLFTKDETVLKALYHYFTSSLSGILTLCMKYDIMPTFISKQELKDIYSSIASNNDNSMKESDELSYEEYLLCLAKIAIVSLSKPMFNHLYSTDKAKVNVLLNMWGIADIDRINRIKTT